MMNKWEKLANDLEGVEEAGEFINIERGAHLAKIVDVIYNEEKNYLTIQFDFVEGKYKDFYKNRKETLSLEKWDFNGQFIRSMNDNALPFFKSFITTIEKSNEGYNFKKEKGNPTSLVGKLFVATYVETEIPVLDEKNNNKPQVHVKFYKERSIQSLNEGKIKLPEAPVKLSGDYDINRYKELLEKETHYTKENDKQAGTEYKEGPTVTIDDLPF